MSIVARVRLERMALMRALAADVARWLDEALAERGRATLAVPGGTTPAPFLDALSRAPIDWSRVSVCPSDERHVEPGSPRSNEALVRTHLLQSQAEHARWVSLYPGPALDDAAIARVDARVRALLPLDVCVLGMGEDGHTASLFPGADRLAQALDADASAQVHALRAPGAPEARITLGASAIAGARRVCLLITGEAKSRVLETALLDGPAAQMPIRVVLHGPTPVHLYCTD